METLPPLFGPHLDDLVRTALAEDIGMGDITSELTLSEEDESTAEIRAKQNMVVAGLPVAERVFRVVDPTVQFQSLVQDGTRVSGGTCMARAIGRTRSLLAGERVALNLLQRLSGIAALARRFVDTVHGLPVRIVDTRKTTPGLRMLEKYAVRMGGASNHRMGLYDGILIKENHIARNLSLRETVLRVREKAPHLLRIEVEVTSLEQLAEAIEAGADVIMLDNMDLSQMKEAVRTTAGRVPLEASGNVTVDNVRAIAETGVTMISVGALTHSAPASDISMILQA